MLALVIGSSVHFAKDTFTFNSSEIQMIDGALNIESASAELDMSRVWLVFFPQLWWCSDTLTMQGSFVSAQCPPALELGQSVRAFRNTASGDSKEVNVIESHERGRRPLEGFLSGGKCIGS